MGFPEVLHMDGCITSIWILHFFNAISAADASFALADTEGLRR